MTRNADSLSRRTAIDVQLPRALRAVVSGNVHEAQQELTDSQQEVQELLRFGSGMQSHRKRIDADFWQARMMVNFVSFLRIGGPLRHGLAHLKPLTAQLVANLRDAGLVPAAFGIISPEFGALPEQLQFIEPSLTRTVHSYFRPSQVSAEGAYFHNADLPWLTRGQNQAEHAFLSVVVNAVGELYDGSTSRQIRWPSKHRRMPSLRDKHPTVVAWIDAEWRKWSDAAASAYEAKWTFDNPGVDATASPPPIARNENDWLRGRIHEEALVQSSGNDRHEMRHWMRVSSVAIDLLNLFTRSSTVGGRFGFADEAVPDSRLEEVFGRHPDAAAVARQSRYGRGTGICPAGAPDYSYDTSPTSSAASYARVGDTPPPLASDAVLMAGFAARSTLWLPQREQQIGVDGVRGLAITP